MRTVRGEVAHWQQVRGKVYVSNEQPGLTPVFGETQQPGGASEKLRDYAFEFGEGTNRHWMALMAADRMERMGKLAGDALRGRPDNWIAEKGWFASYTYRQSNRTLITAALLFGGVLLGGELWRRSR